MSGRQIEKNSHKPKFGLITRIQSHASGRLSVDQFFGYVANCLVIPSLKPSEPPRFASGDLKLDSLTKKYIHQPLEFQYVVVDTSEGTYKLEHKALTYLSLSNFPSYVLVNLPLTIT